MPVITSLDLENAKVDVDHIADIANSELLTATDRLGNTKATMKGAVIAIEAKVSEVESAKESALVAIPDILASIPDKGVIGFETRDILYADLNHLQSTIALVTNDPVSDYNTTYRKVGASGSGSWVQATFQSATKDDIELLQTQQDAINIEIDNNNLDITSLETAQAITDALVTPIVENLQTNVAMHDDDGRKYALVIGDETRMSFGALEKGGVRFKDTIVEQSNLGMDEDAAGRTAFKQLPNGFQFGPWKFAVDGTGFNLMDIAGRTAFAVTHTGKVIAPGILLNKDNPLIRTLTPFVKGGHRATEIKHIVVNGQSLSRGVSTLTPISTAQPYSNITLESGVLLYPTDSAYDASAFKPLIEEVAESPTSSICNGIVRRIVGDGEDHEDWVFLGTSTGSSGKSVEQLSEGSDWIKGLKQVITDSYELAESQGQDYSVWAHVYIQGEAQYVAGVSDEVKAKNPLKYAGKVLDLHESITSHIMATTGQKFRPYLVTYQTGAHRYYEFDTMPVALSQWRSSRFTDNVVLAVPVYAMPHAADSLHLTNEGSWLMGEYISRAIYHTMYRSNEKWKPLEPVKITWTDTAVTIKFNVPYGEIVLDNVLCALTANSGFDVWHGDTVASIITSVSVVAEDTVQINLSAPANADAILSYARGRPGDPFAGGPVTGPRGNLRDTHGLVDTAVSPLGNTFPLHNPCVMFEYHRQKGF